MAIIVADLELNTLLPTITLPERANGVLALVRRHGRPVGIVRINSVQQVITPERLQQEITAQVFEHSLDQFEHDESEPISIVVCTHERPDDLQRCLDGLAPIAAAGHEVIVVDNAPVSQRTAQVVARYPFRYLCESRQGLNHARNCGLMAARYPIVAYTDDDAVPDAQWATAIAAPFQSPAVGCVTGLVMPLELETMAQQQFEVYCTARRTFEPVILAAPEVPPSMAGIAGMGANMAIRRDLALSLGGFDPRLDAGTPTCSGGDTDMFAQVLEAGHSIVYTPDALVWHRHRREDDALRSCIFGYGIGLSSFLTKRLIERRDLQAVVITARWFAGPIVKAVQQRFQGKPSTNFSLVGLEAAGMFLGPFRLWQATRRQQRLGQLASIRGDRDLAMRRR